MVFGYEIIHFKRSDFNDRTLKNTIEHIGYRVQSLHHDLLFKSNKILYDTTGNDSLHCMVLISFNNEDLKVYHSIINKCVQEHLIWTLRDTRLPVKKIKDLFTSVSQSL